jgi:hypothetical protein
MGIHPRVRRPRRGHGHLPLSHDGHEDGKATKITKITKLHLLKDFVNLVFFVAILRVFVAARQNTYLTATHTRRLPPLVAH